MMTMMIIMMLAFLTKFPPTVKFRSDQVKFPEATQQIYGAGWTLNTASLFTLIPNKDKDKDKDKKLSLIHI